MTTPILGIPEISTSMAGKSEVHNEGNRILEQSGNRFRFISRTVTAQPGSPSDGDCYLVPTGATGADWGGQDGKIAQYIGTSWRFQDALNGFEARILDEQLTAEYNGTAWLTNAPVDLVDAATIAVDFAQGYNFNVTLGGNRTLGNPSNQHPGQTGRIRVTQDGTGGHSLTLAGDWQPVGSAPSIVTTPGAKNLFAYFVNADGDIEISYVGALA